MNPPAQNNGTHLWRVLEACARRRRFALTFVLSVTAIAAIVSFALPKWYKAEALLLPPKDTRMVFTNDAADLAELASLTGGLNLPVMATASDVYVRILESRTLADNVIDSLNLIDRYKVDSRTDARLALKEYVVFKVTPEGLIQIQCVDKDPETAARIANLFVAELDRVNRRLTSARSSESRLFLERRLVDARAELDSARKSLQDFQTKYKALDLDKQTELAIASAATLKAELATASVDLSVKRRSLSDSHPEVMELENRVKELRLKITELEFGDNDSSYFSLPIASTPYLTSRLADLKTRVAVAEKLYENLTVRFDEARLQEKREAPSVGVLDLAETPELRYRPQRALIVGGSFALSVLAAILLVLFFDYLARLEVANPADFARASYFFRTILGKKTITLGHAHAPDDPAQEIETTAEHSQATPSPERDWPTDIVKRRIGR